MDGPEVLSKILNRTLDGLGLLPKAKKYQVFSMWRRMVGNISRNAKPRRLDGDVLYVATSSAAWAQELTLMRGKIRAAINRVLGGNYIKEVRFSEHMWSATVSNERLSDGRSRQHVGDRAFSTDELTESDERRIGLYLSEIKDPKLRDKFKKLSIAMHKRKKYLLYKGFKSCSSCGYVYPPTQGECPFCKMKKELSNYLCALSILENRPEISNLGVSVHTGIKDMSVIEKARRELDTRWSRIIRHYVATAKSGDERRTQIKELAEKLVALRSGKSITELGEDEIKALLGRKIVVMLKGE